MAYDDSGELPIASDPSEENTYGLGGYNFELKVQNTHEPGEPDVVSVFAICRSPDGSRQTQAMDFPAGTTVEGWYVEANEAEASVYVKTKNNVQPLDTSPVSKPIPQTNSVERYSGTPSWPYAQDVYNILSSGFVYRPTAGGKVCFVLASSTPMEPAMVDKQYNAITGIPIGESYYNIPSTAKMTHNGKTVYYSTVNVTSAWGDPRTTPIDYYAIPDNHIPNIAWTMIYGEEIGKEAESLIGRFAIDLREADGGPDGDWDEPGDVGPDPEKHYTLTVSVTGASAGSNNGMPLEAGQAGGYGDGGTGGNGGGGGAGASTVIIWDFATSKADNVVQEATAQGPGTGGPGGKGGKGGDGCILIFY